MKPISLSTNNCGGVYNIQYDFKEKIKENFKASEMRGVARYLYLEGTMLQCWTVTFNLLIVFVIYLVPPVPIVQK